MGRTYGTPSAIHYLHSSGKPSLCITHHPSDRSDKQSDINQDGRKDVYPDTQKGEWVSTQKGKRVFAH
ncbi:MAG: hypothetical protein NC453_27475 [Muribaculum sp.]|nr:hypothetical protein [Muribaculum sp.]